MMDATARQGVLVATTPAGPCGCLSMPRTATVRQPSQEASSGQRSPIAARTTTSRGHVHGASRPPPTSSKFSGDFARREAHAGRFGECASPATMDMRKACGRCGARERQADETQADEDGLVQRGDQASGCGTVRRPPAPARPAQPYPAQAYPALQLHARPPGDAPNPPALDARGARLLFRPGFRHALGFEAAPRALRAGSKTLADPLLHRPRRVGARASGHAAPRPHVDLAAQAPASTQAHPREDPPAVRTRPEAHLLGPRCESPAQCP